MTETQNVPDHPAFRVKHPGHLTLEKIMITLAIATLIELILSALLEGGTLSLEIGGLSLVVIAVFKAILIAGFFMHLFYERKPFIIVFIAFVAPLLVGLPIALIILTI